MTIWLSAGIIFTLLSVAYILVKWGNMKVVGVTPVRTFTFIAILFTSGLDNTPSPIRSPLSLDFGVS